MTSSLASLSCIRLIIDWTSNSIKPNLTSIWTPALSGAVMAWQPLTISILSWRSKLLISAPALNPYCKGTLKTKLPNCVLFFRASYFQRNGFGLELADLPLVEGSLNGAETQLLLVLNLVSLPALSSDRGASSCCSCSLCQVFYGDRVVLELALRLQNFSSHIN